MFVDMDVSRDVMAGFRAAAAGDALPAGLDVSVSVLTAGYWPTYDAGGDVKLPPDLASTPALKPGSK